MSWGLGEQYRDDLWHSSKAPRHCLAPISLISWLIPAPSLFMTLLVSLTACLSEHTALLTCCSFTLSLAPMHGPHAMYHSFSTWLVFYRKFPSCWKEGQQIGSFLLFQRLRGQYYSWIFCSSLMWCLNGKVHVCVTCFPRIRGLKKTPKTTNQITFPWKCDTTHTETATEIFPLLYTESKSKKKFFSVLFSLKKEDLIKYFPNFLLHTA